MKNRPYSPHNIASIVSVACAICVFALFSLVFCEKCAAQASFGSLADAPKTTDKAEKPKKSGKNAPKPGNAEAESAAPAAPADSVALLGTASKKKYRYGMEFEARPGGECSDLFGSVPIPADWPEQKVRLIEETFPPEARTGYRDLKEGGCRQMLFKMRKLQAGQKIEACVVVEVTRFEQKAPENPNDYNVPKKLSKEMRRYLKESPFIEVEDRKIKNLAKDAESFSDIAWEQVDAAFKYVRENVKYIDALKEKPIRGALAAIETGQGDCEDMTALFIAILRNLNIPARTVRVPEHCWAEFYLENAEGNGQWFPAQVAGNEPLGVLTDLRPILQKGDAFNLPESPRETTRYVKELFKGEVKQNGPDPKVQFIQEEVGR